MESCKLKEVQALAQDEIPSSQQNATLSLKRLLQRHIRCLINALPELEGAEKDGEKHVVSMANLLEQRECVNWVEETNIQLISTFPDLRSKLLLKISAEVEKEIVILKNLLVPVKSLQQAMQQARADILSFASQRASLVNQAAMYQGTGTVPPLTELMDSIQNAEKEARELYCSRIFYLDDISEQSTVTSENFTELWSEGATRIFETIKDCQQLVKYFLEEKL